MESGTDQWPLKARRSAERQCRTHLSVHLRGQTPWRVTASPSAQSKETSKALLWHIRRGQIPNRVGIEQRPAIVASKRRFGDWEADTIIGARHRGGILSFVERKSKLTRLHKLESKAATEVKDSSIALLAPLVGRVHTITVDNGKEFVQHEEITAALQAPIYFTHPYAAWERGLNENTNGLIRQYFPKKYDFSAITNDDVLRVEARLNTRPRKTLGFKTPNEVFFKQRLKLF